MREIKFRAWVYSGYEKDGNTPGNPAMYYGVQDFYDGNINGSKELKYSGHGFESFGALLDSDKLISIMQYTGLKDKSKKEIYEGDVFRVEAICGVVKYIQDQYMVDYLRFCYGAKHESEKGEVIGNIYENPELMPIKDPLK